MRGLCLHRGDWVYRIDLGNWTELVPPEEGEVAQKLPIIYYQGGDLRNVTRWAWDPRKATAEVDFPFDITLAEITGVQRTSSPRWVDMTAGEWAALKEEDLDTEIPPLTMGGNHGSLGQVATLGLLPPTLGVHRSLPD